MNFPAPSGVSHPKPRSHGIPSRLLSRDEGMATVEAAIALAAIVAGMVLCLGALLATSAQIRCVDAAREAARLAARGDTAAAISTARRVAPPGADIAVSEDGNLIVATVTARTPLLPPIRLRASAVAAREPGEHG